MADAATVSTYDVVGMREDLHNMISDISPMDTPFLSGLGDGGSVENRLVEWLVDELEARDLDNAKPEGWVASFSQPSQPVRVGNRTQISAKTLKVARTPEQVDLAGRDSEYDRQLIKRGKELKIDQESIMLANQGGDDADRTTARRLAALPAWVKTNVSKHSTGIDPLYTSGVPSGGTGITSGQGRKNGTARAMTESLVQDVMQMHAENTSDAPTVLMLGAFNKRKASDVLDGVAPLRLSGDATGMPGSGLTTIAAVDIYLSDFGPLAILFNRWQRTREGWFINWEYVKLCVLHPYTETDLAITGDFKPGMLLTEYTLKVINEAGLGLLADLTVS